MIIKVKVTRTFLLSVIGITLQLACSPKKEVEINQYFDVSEFIDQQLTLLIQQQPELVKTVSFGDSIESTMEQSIDSVQWKKELKIFKEHDINKPVLVNAYNVQEIVADRGKHIKYKLIDSTESGILNLEILFNRSEQPTTLRSTFKEDNFLYGNFREVSLTTNAEGALESYRITGYHKLMLTDTVHYQLEAKLNYR